MSRWTFHFACLLQMEMVHFRKFTNTIFWVALRSGSFLLSFSFIGFLTIYFIFVQILTRKWNSVLFFWKSRLLRHLFRFSVLFFFFSLRFYPLMAFSSIGFRFWIIFFIKNTEVFDCLDCLLSFNPIILSFLVCCVFCIFFVIIVNIMIVFHLIIIFGVCKFLFSTCRKINLPRQDKVYWACPLRHVPWFFCQITNLFYWNPQVLHL